MRIDDVQNNAVPGRTPARKQAAGREIFSGLLSKSMQLHGLHTPSPAGPGSEGAKMILGQVNGRTPTVSHVLARNPEHGKDTWRIIHNQINSSKDFTRIPNGAAITMDPATREISWQSPGKSSVLQAGSLPADPAAPRSGPIRLGRVSDALPTVSHVLASNPEHAKNTWQIISSDINSSKDFTRIPNGAVITMDPATLELSWDNTPPVVAAKPALPILHEPRPAEPEIFLTGKPDSFSAGLERAVRRHVGRPYNDVNCYDLVVQGLEAMGVRYTGRNGIYDKMVSLAREKGLAGNAYVTGEGLVEVAGTKIYGRQISRPRNPSAEARAVYQEMQPLLEPGLVLSFSTRSHGHTGIISRSNKEWTYINSGYIDNDISQRPAAKRVGEEKLSAEIANWMALAARSREPLSITIGRLHDNARQAAPRIAKADSPGFPG